MLRFQNVELSGHVYRHFGERVARDKNDARQLVLGEINHETLKHTLVWTGHTICAVFFKLI